MKKFSVVKHCVKIIHLGAYKNVVLKFGKGSLAATIVHEEHLEAEGTLSALKINACFLGVGLLDISFALGGMMSFIAKSPRSSKSRAK